MKRKKNDVFPIFGFGLAFTGYGLCFMFAAYVFRYYLGARDVDLKRASVGLVVGILLILAYRILLHRQK